MCPIRALIGRCLYYRFPCNLQTIASTTKFTRSIRRSFPLCSACKCAQHVSKYSIAGSRTHSACFNTLCRILTQSGSRCARFVSIHRRLVCAESSLSNHTSTKTSDLSLRLEMNAVPLQITRSKFQEAESVFSNRSVQLRLEKRNFAFFGI